MEERKVSQQINDIVGDNVRKLAALFPAAVKDGEVDFEALREELGQFKEVSAEKYEMTWAGKINAKKIVQEDITGRTLNYCAEESVDPETTENLYIEGDNLEVLKLLRQNYYGAIRMIYIDPPYNTGNDYVYKDNFYQTKKKSDEEEGIVGEDGECYSVNVRSTNRFHATWLSMMYSRLKLAKDLLSDNGIIFISIDSNEVDNLSQVCNEIFGEENCLAKIVWKNKYGAGGGTNGIAYVHEYILAYSKSQIESLDTELSKELQESYTGRDEKFDLRGGYVTQPLASTSKGERPNLMYSFMHEGELVSPPKGGRWVWSKEKFDEAYKNNEIVVNKTATGHSVRFKQYLYDENGLMRKGTPLSMITDVYNQEGSKEAAELLGDKRIFGFPKPTKLLQYLLKFSVNGDDGKDGIVLDFFSGSSSTADAVMQLNAQDGGHRKFIMVQYPEIVPENSEAEKAGFHTIPEIGRERIKRVGERIKQSQSKKETDVGFKVFKTADTNIKWNSLITAGQLDITQIESTPDQVDFMPGSKDEDIVYELILRQRDVPLSEKMERLTEIGERTYIYADSYLVCLESKITEGMVDKLASLDPVPVKFIFRDSAFGDDIALKDETFRRLKAVVDKNAGDAKVSYTVEFI